MTISRRLFIYSKGITYYTYKRCLYHFERSHVIFNIIVFSTGSGIVFKTTPDVIVRMLTEKMTLSCSLKDFDQKTDIKHINYIVIKKLGKSILAMVRDRNQAGVFEDVPNLKVKGQINSTELQG